MTTHSCRPAPASPGPLLLLMPGLLQVLPMRRTHQGEYPARPRPLYHHPLQHRHGSFQVRACVEPSCRRRPRPPSSVGHTRSYRVGRPRSPLRAILRPSSGALLRQVPTQPQCWTGRPFRDMTPSDSNSRPRRSRRGTCPATWIRRHRFRPPLPPTAAAPLRLSMRLRPWSCVVWLRGMLIWIVCCDSRV